MTYQLLWKKPIKVKSKISNFLHLKNVILVVEVDPNLVMTQDHAQCVEDEAK